MSGAFGGRNDMWGMAEEIVAMGVRVLVNQDRYPASVVESEERDTGRVTARTDC